MLWAGALSGSARGAGGGSGGGRLASLSEPSHPAGWGEGATRANQPAPRPSPPPEPRSLDGALRPAVRHRVRRPPVGAAGVAGAKVGTRAQRAGAARCSRRQALSQPAAALPPTPRRLLRELGAPGGGALLEAAGWMRDLRGLGCGRRLWTRGSRARWHGLQL